MDRVELRFVVSRVRPATPTAAGPLSVASIIAAWGMLTVGSGMAWARRTGIAAERLGMGRHSGGRQPTVTLVASPMNPTVGATVSLTVTVSQTNGPVAGFFLTSSYLDKGTFRAVEAGTMASSFGVTHTTPRTGSGGVTTFKAEWSAPLPPPA